MLSLAWFIVLVLYPSGFDVTYYYLPALQGHKPFFYPYWTFWFISPLGAVPFKLNYILVDCVMMLGLIWLIRYTKANPWQLLLSFPFIWVTWYGQLEGFIAIGVVLLWLGFQNNRLIWLGLGLALASMKPHLTVPVALLVLLWLPNWQLRLKSLWLLLPIVLLSFVQWGFQWPLEWLANISTPIFPEAYNNGSLYAWLGVWAFVLWIPAVLVPLERQDRILVFLATTLLTMPYVPPYSQLVLYLWPMPGWVWLLGQLPWLQLVVGDVIFKFNFLLPLMVVLRIYYRSLKARQEMRVVTPGMG
jgi:hypothetical protein